MRFLPSFHHQDSVETPLGLRPWANGLRFSKAAENTCGYHDSENSSTLRQKNQELVAQLREAILRCQSQWRPAQGEPAISTGCPLLDTLLPHHGWRWGTIVEWVALGEGAGAKKIALATVRPAITKGAILFVVDPHRRFYPPAAIETGIPPQAIVVLYPQSTKDTIWTIDQILRTGKGIVVWADVPPYSPAVARRFQLAAEQSGAIGFFFRSYLSGKGPSWSDLQLIVSPLSSQGSEDQWQWRIELHRSRGHLLPDKPKVELSWNEWTGSWDSVSPLARAAVTGGRFARA